MPFKSKAQRRKFAELLVEGKISPETYEEWNRETGGKVLPERVRRTASSASVSSRKSRRRVQRRRGRRHQKRESAPRGSPDGARVKSEEG